MAHPLEGLVLEIENQIKTRDFVRVIVDKETIDKMRRSMMKAAAEAGAGGAGGIDQRIKGREYSLREDANWIRGYIKRKVAGHKLKFIIGGTEIHIMTDEQID